MFKWMCMNAHGDSESRDLETLTDPQMQRCTKRLIDTVDIVLSQRAMKCWCTVSTQIILQKPHAKWNNPDATNHMHDSIYPKSTNSQRGSNQGRGKWRSTDLVGSRFPLGTGGKVLKLDRSDNWKWSATQSHTSVNFMLCGHQFRKKVGRQTKSFFDRERGS